MYVMLISLQCCLVYPDMMPALHNYITVDPTGFTSNAHHLEIIYDMCKAVSYKL